MSALDSRPGWPAGLPLPDLSRPPPWLLPPPPPGTRPPSPPAGGWACNWQEAVPWPPPPPPEGPPEACWPGAAEVEGPRRDDGADWEVTAETDFESEEAYEYAQPGEVLWRAGDDLEEEEESGEAGQASESALELSDEWAARFAATELRRALRKQAAKAASAPVLAQRAGQAESAPTVVDLVRAARGVAAQPDEGRYGVMGALRVASGEAWLRSRFEAELAVHRAPLWPCEPLRTV